MCVNFIFTKYKYLFRVTTDALVPAGYIAHTMDKLKADFGLNKVYIIYQDTLWAKALAGYLKKHCATAGWMEVGRRPDGEVLLQFGTGRQRPLSRGQR